MWDTNKIDGRAWLLHDVPEWVDAENANFFVTVCCQQRGTNQLCLPGVGESILAAGQFYHEQHKWLLGLCLVMPDHVHMLVSFTPDHPMIDMVGTWKRYRARKHGIVWQRNFFDHRLRTEASAAQKADYILQNPVRAGLAQTAAEWPFIWMPG